jgi:hypothetical protein
MALGLVLESLDSLFKPDQFHDERIQVDEAAAFHVGRLARLGIIADGYELL